MEQLSLDVANRIVAAARERAQQAGFKPMGIVVLDAAGQVKLVSRDDGATALRIEIAEGKASAAFGMGVASRTLLARAKDNPAFFNAIGTATSGKFVPQTGAVVITSASGTVLGAIGASGGTGDEDELICIAGIEAAGLSHR
ncbi:heme-binding protein [Paraburkholderia sp.]|uniref:GlcG/HbpS family heme-binding protein n=1 Tax=Paraburkholderia sp. TaxID=1926495 RepID=UPI00239EED24|nr:heme-binding protein [Paraburkholderia sp.]MDE1184743.1 heme-binding protein [Paraburkholderia sp.]